MCAWSAGALAFGGLVEDLREGLDLAPVVDLRLVELVLQRLQLRRVGRLCQLGLVVVGLEGAVDVLGVVDEVEHERRVLAGDHPVQARERLHRLHAVEPLVHVHRVQQRLVEAGLVLVGDQQHLVVGRVEALRQLRLADRLAGHDIGVHPRLGVLEARVRVAHRAAEGDQRADVRVAVLGDVALEGQLVAHRVQARRGDHHRLRPPAEPVPHAAPEVLDHHLGLLLDVVRVQAHELGQRPRRLLLRQRRIVLDRLHQPVVGGVGGVVRQHVEDEALLDRLPHAVEVEGLGHAARARPPEQLQRLALGRGGEGEEAQVRLPPARLHHLVQPVFPVGLAFVVVCRRRRPRIAFSSRAVSPVWLECASSTITA